MYVTNIKCRHSRQEFSSDFPRGPVDMNEPANAGDMGSIPGPGRFHMLQGNLAHAPQLLKWACPEPILCNKRSHCSEKPAHSSKDPVKLKLFKRKKKIPLSFTNK